MPRGKELSPQLRSRICELRTNARLTYRQIHQLHPEVPLSTIKYTVKVESQRKDCATLLRPGRPPKLSEDDRDHLYEVVTDNPTIKQVDLLAEVDHKVKTRALRILLHAMK